MFGNTHIQVRLAQGIAVIAAAAALLVPAASASPFITDTLAPGGSMSLAHKWFLIEHSDQTAQPQGYRFITDTLAPGGKPAPVEGYRFITDTLAPGGGTSVESVPTGTGFDWADAGIGAGAMAGIAMMLLGSVRLLHRRNPVAA